MRNRPSPSRRTSGGLDAIIYPLFGVLISLLLLQNLLFFRFLSSGETDDADFLGLRRRAAGVRKAAPAGGASGDGGGGGLAACLLVRDENPRLPEWIAYHHAVLPLRHLIVAVDPGSGTSPRWVLDRWRSPELGMTVEVWQDSDYLAPTFGVDLYSGAMRPPPGKEIEYDYRERQNQFVVRCLDRHRAAGRSWVLAIDVDEYVTFNRIHPDDPPPPTREAPAGIPTLRDWSWSQDGARSLVGKIDVDGVEKTTKTGRVVSEAIGAGFVAEDDGGARFFLRDDESYHNETGLDAAPPGVPTLRYWMEGIGGFLGFIYGSNESSEGELFMTDGYGGPEWNGRYAKRFGGQVIRDDSGKQYFLEKLQRLWPPMFLDPSLVLEERKKLPKVGSGETILDVLHGISKGPLGKLGPCLSMPRLRYSSKEEEEESESAGSGIEEPEEPKGLAGISRKQFLTYRFRHHASKTDFEMNKFGKTLIDVSRIAESHFKDPETSVHSPLKYVCHEANDIPPYSAAILRVNHYLDTWEAYTYRDDARGGARRCRSCYDEIANRAAEGQDDDTHGWLEYFIRVHGSLKATDLLVGAGDFSPERVAPS